MYVVPFLIVLIVVGAVLWSIARARTRQKLLQAQLRAMTAAKPFGETAVHQQGNIRVKVTTSATASDPAFQAMADQLAQQFSSMPSGAFTSSGLKPDDFAAVNEAFGEAFGKTMPNLLQHVQEAAAAAQAQAAAPAQGPVAQENPFAEPAPEPAPIYTRQPAAPPPARESAADSADPFTAGNIFDRHKEDAERSFGGSSSRETSGGDRSSSDASDPFRR